MTAEQGWVGDVQAWHLPRPGTSNNPHALTLHQPGRWCDLTCVPVAVRTADDHAALVARARAEGVNEGVRLAASLIRQHALDGEEGEAYAVFLERRAARAAEADPTPQEQAE